MPIHSGILIISDKVFPSEAFAIYDVLNINYYEWADAAYKDIAWDI